jgi:hypothetical protein
MKTLILAALLLAPLPAFAASYVLVCADAVTYPACVQAGAGTAINRVQWDGVTTWTVPNGLSADADTGQAIYAPPAPAATTMPFTEFYGRFTTVQRTGLWSKMVSDTTLADDWWAFMGVVSQNGGIVDPTTPQVTTLAAYCVTKGYLTAAQATALLAPPY